MPEPEVEELENTEVSDEVAKEIEGEDTAEESTTKEKSTKDEDSTGTETPLKTEEPESEEQEEVSKKVEEKSAEEDEPDWGRGAVINKADRILRAMENPYGIAREHEENIKENVKYNNLNEVELRKKLDELLLR